jgi:hypothetical protein
MRISSQALQALLAYIESMLPAPLLVNRCNGRTRDCLQVEIVMDKRFVYVKALTIAIGYIFL